MLKTGLIVVQNGLYHTPVIVLEGVCIVIVQMSVLNARRVSKSPTIAETPWS